MTEDQAREILKDAETCPRLTPWEESFCDSLREALSKSCPRNLSDRQIQVLRSIEKKVYA